MRAIKRVSTAFAVVAAAGVPHSAGAQALADSVLHPGSRVRVESSALGSTPREGIFVSLANDTLSVRLKGEPAVTRIVVDQVSALEVSVGRTHNMIRDADRGSHYGGWTGAVIGGIAGAATPTYGASGVRALFIGIGAVGGYFVGRMYGTVAGGVAGAVDRDDVWKPVILPARGAAPIGSHIPGSSLPFGPG